MATTPTVNNDVFATLGERWYEASDDPIALLRAQAALHGPFIAEHLHDAFAGRPGRVLDVGCGGGLIANDLARRGHAVVGVDIAPEALEVAARHDATGRARWVRADARELPFDNASFDAVCAMDFLEHVEPIDGVLREASRVLAPGGLFFFHTFDRTILSWLVVIKGVEWFVRNTPPHLHVLRLFIRPSELRAACAVRGLDVEELHGCGPAPSRALASLLLTGVVPADLTFRFTRSTLAGYTGMARKLRDPH
jgi:2-polyprenyl-6-hydroxyphenyl methylase / 3-demethylubiquinone-9 3-methyltransferase